MEKEVKEMMNENARRMAEVNAKFNPVTGECSIGQRKKIVIEDYPLQVQYLPLSMMKVPLVAKIVKAGSVRSFLCDTLKVE